MLWACAVQLLVWVDAWWTWLVYAVGTVRWPANLPRAAPFRWYVALDGGDMTAYTGGAGMMCMEWPSARIHVRYYEGMSYGHNATASPNGRLLLYGSYSQKLVVLNAHTLDVVAEQSSQTFEACRMRMQANTHHVWLGDDAFLVAMGAHVYRVRCDDLAHPVKLVAHGLDSVHQIVLDASTNTLVLGDTGPALVGERRPRIDMIRLAEDANAAIVTHIELQDEVWHIAVRPGRAYGVTYSKLLNHAELPGADPSIESSPRYTREYFYEFDTAKRCVARTWTCAANVPVHLISDLVASETDARVYGAGGAGHTLVEWDVSEGRPMRLHRTLVVKPAWWLRWQPHHAWQTILNFPETLTLYTFTLPRFLQADRLSGGELFDGVYSTAITPCGRFIIAGNRGFNYIRMVRRDTLETVFETEAPRHASRCSHLGFHHSCTSRA
jgi:hypothetical protein